MCSNASESVTTIETKFRKHIKKSNAHMVAPNTICLNLRLRYVVSWIIFRHSTSMFFYFSNDFQSKGRGLTYLAMTSDYQCNAHVQFQSIYASQIYCASAIVELI